MFKSIVSKFQNFGKAVFSRITAFIGGIIGIKPETVEIPAPPEIENSVNNTAPEATEEKEGLIKKAFKTAKKAVVTAIKAVSNLILDVLNLFLNIVIFILIIGSVLGLGLATAYAVNYALIHLGVIALATTLWETKALAEISLLVLALIGVVNITSAIAEVIWYLLLKRIHIFLWSVLFRDALKNIPTNTIVDIDSSPAKNINLEFFNGVYKETVVDSRPTKKEPAMTMKIVEVPVSSAETVSETVTTNEVKDVDIFDSTPVVIEIEEILPEIVPVVIEIEESKPEIVPVVIETKEVSEVVDSRPAKETKLNLDNPNELLAQLQSFDSKKLIEVLNSYHCSKLKTIIKSLNSHIPNGLNKGCDREPKKGNAPKTFLMNEISKQLSYISNSQSKVAVA